MATTRDWDIVQTGPVDAERTVLLLPGGWCTALFYEELMAEPALSRVRLVAVTLPGNGGTPAPPDVSIENYARLTAELAADLGVDVIAGHSFGANVALEMAASGGFNGPLVLLAPSFSRADEALAIRIPERLSRALGDLPFTAMRSAMRFALKGSALPPERCKVLVREWQKNDPNVMRRGIRAYFAYLDRYGSVAERLGSSAVPAWVVHGESGDGGMTEEERRILQAYAWIRIVTIPGPSWLTPNEEPALVAGLVVDALRATSDVSKPMHSKQEGAS